MKNKKDVKKRYDYLYTKGYGHKRSGTPDMTNTGSAIYNILMEIGYLLDKESIILEIGCGEGNLIYPICDKVKMIHGVDISEVAIKNAEKFLKDKTNVKLYIADNINFFDDNTFDVIFEQTVFQHMIKEHVLEYLDQIDKKLKIGGKVFLQIIDDPNYKEIMGTLTTESQSSWTEEEITTELEKRNIKKIYIKKVTVNHQPTYKIDAIYLIGEKI